MQNRLHNFLVINEILLLNGEGQIKITEGKIEAFGTSNTNLTLDADGTGYVNFYGAYSLPRSIGNAGQVLKTDGSGQLAFASVSSLAGAGIQNVSDDSSPQLGGNLDLALIIL